MLKPDPSCRHHLGIEALLFFSLSEGSYGVPSALQNASSNAKDILLVYLLNSSSVPPRLASKHLKTPGSKFTLAIFLVQSDLLCIVLSFFCFASRQ